MITEGSTAGVTNGMIEVDGVKEHDAPELSSDKKTDEIIGNSDWFMLNMVLACQVRGKFIHSSCSSSASCTDECMAIGSSRYLCINGLCAILAVWLNVSHKNQLNRSARE